MADFSTANARQGTDFELIPDDTLAKGWLQVVPFNAEQGHIVTPPKQGSTNSYLKCKITITEGEYERRVIFHNIMRGPEEKALNMGNAQIRAILEYGRNAGPHNPQGYVLPGEQGQEFAPWAADGIPVAVKIGVQKARRDEKTGKEYPANNTVRLFLSPNPESDGHKDYLRLMKGETGPAKAAAPAAPQPAWNKPAAAPAAPAPIGTPTAPAGWGGTTGQAPSAPPQSVLAPAPAPAAAPAAHGRPAWMNQ